MSFAVWIHNGTLGLHDLMRWKQFIGLSLHFCDCTNKEHFIVSVFSEPTESMISKWGMYFFTRSLLVFSIWVRWHNGTLFLKKLREVIGFWSILHEAATRYDFAMSTRWTSCRNNVKIDEFCCIGLCVQVRLYFDGIEKPNFTMLTPKVSFQNIWVSIFGF